MGLLLFVSSMGTVQKYAGTAAVLVSLPIYMLFATVAWPRIELATRRVGNRTALIVALVGLVLIAAVLAVAYPHLNVHTPGQGSDRDDGVNIGARRLLHGEYPYGPRTYLGNPIDMLPGDLLLAAPFVAAFGSVAYSNVFWLAVLVGLLVVLGRPLAAAVIGVGVALALSPGVLREYLTGGDLIANTITVTTAALALYWLAPKRAGGITAALFLGLALASRANFAFLLIPLTAALAGRVGWRRTSWLLAVTAGVACALLAFVVAGSQGREALRVSNQLDALGRFGAALTLLLALLIALGLAIHTRQFHASTILAQAAAVQVIFPVALVVHASIAASRFDASPLVSGYGVPALLLALPCPLLAATTVVAWRRRFALDSPATPALRVG
jgi:hypothetical protein